MSTLAPRSRAGFTLIELLVVIAIIAILAAILFPVFAKVREKARQTSCLSNEKQLGVGLMQYLEDYDEQWPVMGGGPGSAQTVLCCGPQHFTYGMGWAGQIYPYVKSTGVYACPDDPTTVAATPADPNFNPVVVSYAVNLNLNRTDNLGQTGADPHPGPKLSVEVAPASTVLLCEINGIVAQVTDPYENGAETTTIIGQGHTPLWSASTNGAGNNVWPFIFTWGPGGTLATGILGGLPSTGGDNDGPNRPEHGTGSNWLMCDGHAKWLNGSSVSPGSVAEAPDCNQNNTPSVTDCIGYNSGNGPMAAGTSSSQYQVTFSPI